MARCVSCWSLWLVDSPVSETLELRAWRSSSTSPMYLDMYSAVSASPQRKTNQVDRHDRMV
ncbi:hypothetical protein D3C81_2277860 [compost metagenome]